jgi:exodeoxyribonuclease VII small subunit
MTQHSPLSFEAAYAQLETIIEQLESGAVSLEESVALFEQGRQLAGYCQSLLDSAELRINKLTDSGEIEPQS